MPCRFPASRRYLNCLLSRHAPFRCLPESRVRASSSGQRPACLFEPLSRFLAPWPARRDQLPAKELKLEAKHRDTVLSAKTAVVIATVRPLVAKKDKSTVVVTYRAGRVGREKAKSEAEAALKEWGRFTVVQDPAQADLALLVLEETLSPHWGSTHDVHPRPRYRLRNTMVYSLSQTSQTLSRSG